MIKSKPATVSADRLKSFVERINNLLDEKQGLAEDVSDIYLEAKKAGANTTALRKVIAKRRAKKPDPEVEAAMEAYDLALDEAAAMVSNGSTSLRKAATETGFSKSAIHRRASHRNENAASGTPTETGSVTVVATDILDALSPSNVPAGLDGCSTDEDRCLSGRVSRSDEQETANGRGKDKDGCGQTLKGARGQVGQDGGADFGRQPGVAGESEAGNGEDRRHVRPAEGRIDEPTVSLGVVAEGDSPQRVASPKPAEDDLAIPHFLRRVPA